ncbi:NlpC/P60 family protein [Streptomyces sp. NBC_01476]|uniref:C40 family peptidase n=1 Tax=Streptomyces sp. NBC_01476 TaxID=2903881 RepID=UPI002E37CEA3|nr:NlpC/P60 family protein [Streptomyces sp. NBC_01476]
MARRTRGWLRSAVVCGALLAAAALSLPAAEQASARPYDPAPPPPVPPAEMLTQLQTYYRQTEAATESYNQAKQTADKQRAKAQEIDRQLADQRVAVAGAKDELGLMARQMYRSGGVSPYLSLLTGQTPQDFFGQRRVVQRAAEHQQDVLDELTSGEARLSALNTQAQKALDAAQHAQTVLAGKKTQVETHLKEVEAMLAGLTGVQIGELQTLEQQGVDQAQQDLLDSKALGADPALRAPSQPGDRAIAYAYQQLGKPYVWGAQGPDSFDCSGLTSQAWAHAGVTIPRTSEEQWARLPHVPLALLRPGDLVVYFSGASHVALYIGNGLVIQAPRPGAVVKVSPIAANPILGAVRPDLGKQPLKDYKARPVPKQAEEPLPIAVTPPKTAKQPKATKPAAPADPSAPSAPGKTPAPRAGAPKPVMTPDPTQRPDPAPGTPTASPTPTPTPTPDATPSGSPAP